MCSRRRASPTTRRCSDSDATDPLWWACCGLGKDRNGRCSHSGSSRCDAMALVRGVLHVLIGAVLAWEVLALAHLPVVREELRWPLALIFALFCMWAIWWTARRWPKVGVGLLFVALFAIWASIHPSLNRRWRPEVAVMPR